MIRWWPHRAAKIRLRDIGAYTETVQWGASGPCPFCPDAAGLITRESHPFALPFHDTPLSVYPCKLCDGTGVFQPRCTRLVERPKCRTKDSP